VTVKKCKKYLDSHGEHSAIGVIAVCLLHILQMPSNRTQGALDSFVCSLLNKLIYVVDSPL